MITKFKEFNTTSKNKNKLLVKNNITVSEALKDFPNFLYLKGKAKSTSDAYILDIKQFNNFLKVELSNKIRYANFITKTELEQYKKHLLKKIMKNEFKQKTVERKYNSIKVFFKFLNNNYGIENITVGDTFGNKNSARNWNNKYETNKLPQIIKSHEVDKLFNTIYNSNDKNMFRDAAIMELLFNIGCRKSELLNFKWNDINFYDNEISIKRKKTRNVDVVKFNETSKEALVALRELYPNLYSDNYIFKGRNKNSLNLSASALHCVIKKWVNKAGINPKISTHYFRHTFITNCIKQGIQSEIIIKYTGHSDVNALKSYLHLIAKDTIEVANVMDKLRGA